MTLTLQQRLTQGDGTMPSPNRMTWRERALTEHQLYLLERQMEAANTRAAEAQWLSSRLTELLGEPIDCDGPRVTLDGVTFARRSLDGELNLCIVGQCPRCGQEALSHPIWNLSDLGRQIESFAVGYSHRCPDRGPAPSEPTIEDRLATVLRDLIDERVEHCLSTRGGGA